MITADETLGGKGRGSAKDDAVQFLREILAAGARPAKAVERLAVEAGLLASGTPIGQAKAFRLACQSLGVKRKRTGGFASDGHWVWEMPRA